MEKFLWSDLELIFLIFFFLSPSEAFYISYLQELKGIISNLPDKLRLEILEDYFSNHVLSLLIMVPYKQL